MSKRHGTRWEGSIYSVALVFFGIWLGAKLWPNSIFKHWEEFITNKIEMPALMLTFAIAPFYFVWALVRTAREKAAEDRERFRIARGECGACGFNLQGVCETCPQCGRPAMAMTR